MYSGQNPWPHFSALNSLVKPQAAKGLMDHLFRLFRRKVRDSQIRDGVTFRRGAKGRAEQWLCLEV
jgi:hypothetical protein